MATIGVQTLEIDGKACVVIHISDGKFGRTVCTGESFQIPPDNDARPRTLCEACRREFNKSK